jgi:CHAT domain-containing protein/Tfp pilus assembly protein PilF
LDLGLGGGVGTDFLKIDDPVVLVGVESHKLRGVVLGVNRDFLLRGTMMKMKLCRYILLGIAIAGLIVGVGEISHALPSSQVIQQEYDDIDQAIAKGNRFYEKGNIGSLQKAIVEFEIAIQKSRIVYDTWQEGFAWNALGRVHEKLGDIREALDCYQKALPLRQTDSSKAATQNNIGLVYIVLGEQHKALDYFNDALLLIQGEDDYQETLTRKNIGWAYATLGELSKALDNYNRALKLIREIKNNSRERNLKYDLGESAIRNNIGLIHAELGDNETAIAYLNQALNLNSDTTVEGYSAKATLLNNLGHNYYELGKYQEAIKYHKQSLDLFEEIGDRHGQGIALNSAGNSSYALGDKLNAIEYCNRALRLSRDIGDRHGEAAVLGSLGTIYTLSGDRQKALEHYHQALPLVRAVNARRDEATVLSGIGKTLADQGQIESSIIFLKQSVNIYETLRGFVKSFSQEQQISHTKTFSAAYRHLASLLLKQNRGMEAIQVLDLLKAQELRQYLPDRSPNSAPTFAIELLPQEQTFWDRYEAIMQPAIDQSTEFNDLTRLTQPTPQQTQRLNELKRIQDQIPEQLDQYRNSSEANQLFNQLKNTAAQQNLSLPIYKTFQTKVTALSQNAALFYPLVLDDRLELVILIPGKAPIRQTVNVTKAQLETQIKIFRQQIGDVKPNTGIPKNDITTVKQSAQQLYNWLIDPIADDLKAANIQTILYAPDGQLRYIPLAALYDGKEKKWLTQKYQINHLTALALTPIEPASSAPPRTLAAAFTQGTYSFTIPATTADRQSDGTTRSRNTTESIDFSGLSHSRGEVENLSKILKIKPDDKLFDQAFSKAAIVDRLPNYNILHLATHGIFIPDKPEESFIVMGNGEKLRLTDIKGWNFPNLQFVMLSACETGQGQQLSNGIEVLGFGYQLQQAKVRASMTSLWKVHDAGTRLLSQQFYQQAYGQSLRKTAALKKVQEDFISGKMNIPLSQLRGEMGGNVVTSQTPPDATHPYYWAPFIIVGNGL